MGCAIAVGSLQAVGGRQGWKRLRGRPSGPSPDRRVGRRPVQTVRRVHQVSVLVHGAGGRAGGHGRRHCGGVAQSIRYVTLSRASKHRMGWVGG